MRSVPAGGHRGGQHRAQAVRHPAARHRSARVDGSRRLATVNSTPPKQVEAILHIRDRPARGQRINGAIADTATRSVMPAIKPAMTGAGQGLITGLPTGTKTRGPQPDLEV